MPAPNPPTQQAPRRPDVPLGVIALAAALLVLPMLAAPAAAQGTGSVGVSPPSVTYADPALLPGGTQRGALEFQQRYSEPVTVRTQIHALTGDWGDASGWVTLQTDGTRTLSPGTHRFLYQIQVPHATPNGQYKAGVTFKVLVEDKDTSGNSRATTETSVTATLTVIVDDAHQVQRIAVLAPARIPSVETGGPLHVHIPIANTGNVDARPQVRLQVLDQAQERVVRTFWFNDTTIAPGVDDEITYAVPQTDLPIGQYWAAVVVRLAGQEVWRGTATTFDVLPVGALSRVAELRTMRLDGDPTQASVGQRVQVEGVVRNIGEAPFVARLHVQVWRDGVLVDTLESAPVDIPMGGTETLPILYRPDAPGKYAFHGRVAYAEKVTEEKSVLLTVGERSGSIPIAPLPLVVGVLLGVLVVARRTVSRRHP